MASRRGAAGLVAAAFVAAAAFAHPMLIVAGSLAFDSEAVWVTVPREGAGLDHFGLDERDGASVPAFARMLSESIAVVDEAGDRLEGSPPVAGNGAATVRYALRGPTGAVSLRLLPGGPVAVRGGQLHLRAPTEGAPSVRLSRGGAPTTVRDPSLAAPTDAAEAWVWAHRFERVLALVSREVGGVRVDVIVPLPVVETWMPLTRASEDAVTSEEAAPVLEAFGALVAGKLGVRVGDGAVSVRVARTGLLAPSEASVDELVAKGRLGFWGACAVVRLESDGPVGDGALTLECSLFNSAVKRVYATVGSGPARMERVMTPSENLARWE